jgi:TolB-like protein/Flp pilus assembly protein TadD
VPHPLPQFYEFGPFRVDASKRLLARDGAPVPLTPKVFDTLVHLVQHSGTAIGKDELMRAIWPDTVVEENNLNQNISILRRILGDGRSDHRYIATVPGYGYQFVAEVKLSRERSGQLSPANGASIAVLPFANLSADASNQYFCDGLAEELINALAKLGQIRVVARTSAFSFKGKETDVREIGRKLRVSTVLEGSVRKSGNRLRITVQLINAANGYHVWSERYDTQMQDIFDVQDEITLAIVSALKLRLLGKEKSVILKHHTENPKAYLSYLKGQYYRWKTAPEEFRKCREYFEQAVNADPFFALGYFGLNSYYGYGSAWGLIPPDEGWPKAHAALIKALELDDTLPEAHLSHAAFLLVHDRNWAGAEKEIKRVLALNPKLAEIHHLYSFYFLTVGRFDDAIAEGRRALECDPLSLIYGRSLGMCLYFSRQYDEAVAQYHETLELDQDNISVHELLGNAYERQGRNYEAIGEWQKAAVLARDYELATKLGRAYAETDLARAACEWARRNLEQTSEKARRGEYVPAVEYARAWVRIGDSEQAFGWLEKACSERNVFSLLLNSDPLYDNLRADERFERIRERVGFGTSLRPRRTPGDGARKPTTLSAPPSPSAS